MKPGWTLAVGLAIFAGACATSPERSSVKVPLEIPEPPPRAALDPVPAEDPVPAVNEEDAPPAGRPAVTPAARSAPNSPPPSAAASPASPPATPAPEPPRASPPPELRPAGPAGRTPTAAQVLDRVTRAKQTLDSINRQRLNAGKRADYDSARRFLSQAEAAAASNNLLLAESSVEKAETLANGLR